MTREEQTGIRDLGFSQWVRTNLPDSATGFLASDLDFIFYDYKTNDLMLLEVKTRGARPALWQFRLLKLLDSIIRLGVPLYKGRDNNKIKYHGVHCLRFENTGFDDGRAYLDKVGLMDCQEVTEQEVIEFLSFRWEP